MDIRQFSLLREYRPFYPRSGRATVTNLVTALRTPYVLLVIGLLGRSPLSAEPPGKPQAAAQLEQLASGRPVTGPKTPGVEMFDAVIDEIMTTLGCDAATLAVMDRGRLVISRGYGWKDNDRQQPTQPDTLMRIASCSKPITAAAVKELLRRGDLQPDLKVFPYLALKPYNGQLGDPRVQQITVTQLLEHRGGFDREQAYDPMFQLDRIERALMLSKPATTRHIIEYMLAQPLQFAPGERYCYSNYGYCALGRVIEKATGQSYLDYVQETICRPLAMNDLIQSRNRAADRSAREVDYPIDDRSFSIEVMDAHGGLATSALSLCKFMQQYWISGERRTPGEQQSYHFFGSLPGTTAMIQQRPDSLDCAILFNGRRDAHISADCNQLREKINAALDRFRAQQP